MPKANQMVSMEYTLREALREMAKTRGVLISSIVEDALRAFMGQPAPAPTEVETDLTRTAAQVFKVVQGLPVFGPGGRGWHSSREIQAILGHSHNLIEQTLKGLALEGKVFCWGSGQSVPVLGVNGEKESDLKYSFGPVETRWSSRDAKEITLALITRWDGVPEKARGIVQRVQTMLIGASEDLALECARILNGPLKVDLTAPDVGWVRRTPADVVKFRWDEEQRYSDSPEYAAKKAAEKAAQEKAIDDRRAAMAAHDAEQRRLDREYQDARKERAANYCAGCGGDKRACGCNVSR